MISHLDAYHVGTMIDATATSGVAAFGAKGDGLGCSLAAGMSKSKKDGHFREKL